MQVVNKYNFSKFAQRMLLIAASGIGALSAGSAAAESLWVASAQAKFSTGNNTATVSYTHLTLPTKRIV